jgi:D-beta-D-heptose 7-phosphate kinase/D-beta-D-heptose 1-phosphate adenosyltransferase
MDLNNHNKLHDLGKIAKYTRALNDQGKTTGLITGCFDILHIGHIELFRFAKANCDIVVIGLESDATIKLSKGDARPISSFNQRASLLSELVSVDFIFPVGGQLKFGSAESNRVHEELTNSLRPNFLVLTPATDKYWERKIVRAEAISAKVLKYDISQPTSSSKILDAMLSRA